MNKVVHFEVAADDVDRATRFYSDVFGWQIVAVPEVDYIGITTVEVDEQQMPKEPGAINGGMYKRENAGEPTSIVVSVPSIDEHLPKIEQAGGTVVVPKQEVPNMGYYARVRDTEGNLVGLWEDMAQ
jgi:predicted enzyme related to lactoylglutathione lyase